MCPGYQDSPSICMATSLLQLGQMNSGGFQHQLLGAHLVEGYLNKRVTTHGPNTEHHSLTKGTMAYLISGF